MLADLDKCEKLVGPWNPQNNFVNIYIKIDELQASIEDFNSANDDKSDRYMDSGMRKVSHFMNKAKDFNKELEQLQRKFT